MQNAMRSNIQAVFEHPNLGALVPPNIIGTDTLPSWFNVTELATSSIGIAGSAIARLEKTKQGKSTNVELHQRYANLWFGMTLEPLNFKLPALWDSIAGDYQTKDGWIRLHTNAPHHKHAALTVLECENKREAVRSKVRQYTAKDLETDIINKGGCAAQMRKLSDWSKHEHGKTIENEPLVNWQYFAATKTNSYNRNTTMGALSEVKILDLTRVLAGPVASRFLAGFGADVLRIDPPNWDEPGVIPEVTLGKRCSLLDIKTKQGKKQFIGLLQKADVLLHGYRANALVSLGFSDEEIHNINPNLITVSLNAYGWKGPWQNRRGFDSLVQMSCGIADYGMQKSGTQKPTPLPVQALDQATGYFMATAVIQAIELRDLHDIISHAKCSLAATAHLLQQECRSELSESMIKVNDDDYAPQVEDTDWGTAKRIQFPLKFTDSKVSWPSGAKKLGSFTLSTLDWK